MTKIDGLTRRVDEAERRQGPTAPVPVFDFGLIPVWLEPLWHQWLKYGEPGRCLDVEGATAFLSRLAAAPSAEDALNRLLSWADANYCGAGAGACNESDRPGRRAYLRAIFEEDQRRRRTYWARNRSCRGYSGPAWPEGWEDEGLRVVSEGIAAEWASGELRRLPWDRAFVGYE